MLVRSGDVLISEHGYEELIEDGLTVKDVLGAINEAVVVEEYPNFSRGPCILLLQKDGQSNPIHVVWGIRKGHDRPVILVTAYYPDPNKWDKTLKQRIKK